MRPPEDVKVELVRQWAAKADADLRAAETLLAANLPSFYPACFHAQQAAEKYLKALLTARQVEFPKTHAIEQLLSLLEPVLADVASALQEAAALTPYGVEIRYPADQPEPSEEEARRALSLARQVRNVVTPAVSSDAAP
jgi:HEPN domain-containing protein